MQQHGEDGAVRDLPPTVEPVTWWTYVQRTAEGATNATIAQKSGVTPSSVSRWSSGGRVDPQQAAEFARAYGRPVLEAFVAAGFLTPEEAGERPTAAPSLDSLSDKELLGEVSARLARLREVESEAHGVQPPKKRAKTRADVTLAAREGTPTGLVDPFPEDDGGA